MASCNKRLTRIYYGFTALTTANITFDSAVLHFEKDADHTLSNIHIFFYYILNYYILNTLKYEGTAIMQILTDRLY